MLNHKKLFRLYREERLTRAAPRRPQAGARNTGADGFAARTEPALEPRLRLRQLVDGRRFRVLVVVDDFTRECLALVVDTSLSGLRVARELDAHRRACADGR